MHGLVVQGYGCDTIVCSSANVGRRQPRDPPKAVLFKLERTSLNAVPSSFPTILLLQVYLLSWLCTDASVVFFSQTRSVSESLTVPSPLSTNREREQEVPGNLVWSLGQTCWYAIAHLD